MNKKRDGFTLIEIVAVVLIVAILAVLGMTRFKKTRDRATLASMKSDLKVLSIYEELHFTTSGVYTGSLPIQDQFSTPGVIVTVTSATNGGWSATAERDGLQCGVAMGDADPALAPPATSAGVITCTE